MKKKVLTVLFYSLVLVMASSDLMADDLFSSSDTNAKNWTPYIDGTISFFASGRSIQGNSFKSPAPAIYLSLDHGQQGSTVSSGPNLNRVEPGAMLLLGIGLIGLARFGKRKFKKN